MTLKLYKFNAQFKFWYMATHKHTNASCNAVSLVWGSLIPRLFLTCAKRGNEPGYEAECEARSGSPQQVMHAVSECTTEIEGSYDKTITTIVPRYNNGKKNMTCLLLSALLILLRTYNNTDGNNLMLFSSIPLYYGDTHVCI